MIYYYIAPNEARNVPKSTEKLPFSWLQVIGHTAMLHAVSSSGGNYPSAT